jgi:predicted RND superfamily exporter protein
MNDRAATPANNASLSLGLERIGFLPLMFPWVSVLVVVAVTALAYVGFSRLSVDDSLSELFRTDTPAFNDYARMSQRFPTSEFDVLIVAEGDTLLERDTLEKLRFVILDLQLVSSVRNLVSLFSAREPPDAAGQIPPALFPAVLPEGEEYQKLIERVKSNKIIQGKLLSDDGKLALVVIALDPKTVAGAGLGDAVSEIRSIALGELKDTGLSVQLSGAPVMQQEIRNAVERDRFVYNGAGLILGALIAIAFFRRISLMLSASVPPILAIFWSLGTFGLMGFKLNLFLNVMTPLVMVLGFSDSMQLTFAIRDRINAGMEPKEAIRHALIVVGPACVLASVTASASFLTLLLVSDSALIRTFGAAGAISTLVAYIASIVLVPLLALFLLRPNIEEARRRRFVSHDPGIDWLKSVCARLADLVVAHAGKVFLAGLALVVAFGAVYLTLNPRYRLADQVPDREEAVEASQRLDAKLTGANPLEVMIEWPKDRTLYEEETVDVIGAVHRALEHQKGVGNVWSVETLVRWMKDSRDYSLPRLKDYIEVLPPHLVRRFLDLSSDSALVSGRIPDIDASEILPVIAQLEKELQKVRDRHPNYKIVATGLSVVAARNSAGMISGLNYGLIGEMLFISAFLGLTFRSILVAGASLLPNLFPIFAAGGVLAAAGAGLQFASIIALTIAFGLTLNAAVHYFNRLRLEHTPGEDPAIGVARATTLVGPAVILTTMVLAVGLGVTTFSDLPSLRLFGWLTTFTLLAGVISDLLLLPSVILLMRRAYARMRGVSAART